MNALLRVVSLVAALLALSLFDAPGRADDELMEVIVRERMTLLHGGDPVPGAYLALVKDGEGPEQALGAALRTDTTGRAAVPAPSLEQTLLVWGDGFAPAAFRVQGAGTRRIAVEPARPLVVRVLGVDGRAAVGAEVRIDVALPTTGAPEPSLAPHRFVLRGTTSADGTARFEGLSADAVTVTVTHDDAVETSLFPVLPGPDTVTLALDRGVTVAGHVLLQSTGKPPRRGEVQLDEATIALAADGAFRFERVRPGTRALTVRGPDIVSPPALRLVLRDRQDRDDLVVRVTPAATLAGTLHLTVLPDRPVDSVATRAIAFRLTWPPGSGPPPDHVPPPPLDVTPRVDPAGGFLVTGLPPGEGVVLEVRRDGAVPTLVEGLSLAAGGRTEGLWIELDPGGALTGTLADAEGEAVPGAAVRAYRTSGTRTSVVHATTTGDDGVFRLDGLPSPDVTLEVIPPATARAAPWRSEPLSVRRGETVDVGTLRLPAGHTLRGRIDGAPDGVVVTVVQGERVVGPLELVAGEFVARGLSPGDVRIEAATPGRAPAVTHHVTVPAASPVRLDWRASHSVVVVVQDLWGAAVPGGTVRAVPDDGHGGADATDDREPVELSFRNAVGRAALDLPVGRWTLVARGDDGATGTLGVELDGGSGLSEVVITLDPGEVVRGHVVGLDTGGPIEGAHVTIVSGGPEDGALSAVTDERGWYEIGGVSEGLVRVRVEAAGYAVAESAPVSVRRGGTPVLEPMELARGTLLRGTVASLRSPVPEGARVTVESDRGGFFESAVDLYGRFELAGVPGGFATVRVDAAAGRTWARRVRVPWTDVHEMHLDLDEGTELFGTVRTAGRPEPFARVTAHAVSRRGEQLDLVETRADAFGRYRLPPVGAGDVTVSVELGEAGVVWSRDASVPDAFDHPLDLDLPEGWVAGRVVAGSGGAPVPGAFVRVTDGVGAERVVLGQAVSDARGLFRIERLPLGTHTLEVTRAGYATVRQTGLDVATSAGVPGLDVVLPDEAALAAVVLDERRRIVPGAWLRAERTSETGARVSVTATIGPSGDVLLRGLEPGPWRIVAGAPRRGTTDQGVLDLAPGRYDAGEIHLPYEAAVVVTVFRVGFVPRAGALVRLGDALGHDPRPPQRPTDAVTGPDRRYVTGTDGNLVLDGLAPGIYRVWLDGDEDSAVTVRVGDAEIARVWLLDLAR